MGRPTETIGELDSLIRLKSIAIDTYMAWLPRNRRPTHPRHSLDPMLAFQLMKCLFRSVPIGNGSSYLRTGCVPRRPDLGRRTCATHKRIGEKGAGHLKAIIWTLILASVVYVAIKVIPVLVNEYEFQDGIQNIARFASVNRQSNEQIRQSVLKEAEKDNLPVDAKSIKAEISSGNVSISVEYSVTVDLNVYQWTLNFHPVATNNALF